MSTHYDIPPSASTLPASGVRVSFRQPVSTGGFVDAAWWPHSHDLVAELPDLLDVLWTAGRDVNRISYNVDAWDPAPARITVAGRVFRLGAFHHQDPLLVTLVDVWGRERVDVLVIPPDIDPAVGEAALALVAESEGHHHPGEILAQAAEEARRVTTRPRPASRT